MLKKKRKQNELIRSYYIDSTAIAHPRFLAALHSVTLIAWKSYIKQRTLKPRTCLWTSSNRSISESDKVEYIFVRKQTMEVQVNV